VSVYKLAKVVITLMVISQGFYYANTQPGIMDTFNGTMGGLVVFVLWLSKESK